MVTDAPRGHATRIAWAATLALTALPAFAADKPEQQLKAVERALAEGRDKQARAALEAEKLAAEVATLRTDSMAAARAAQEHEAALTQVEAELAALAADESAKSKALIKRRQQQVELLSALQRLARNPPEALALGPEDPNDAVRSALVLGATVPQVEALSRALGQEINALESVRAAMAAKRREEATSKTALAREQKRLAGLIERKSALQTKATKEAESTGQRLQTLASQAADLRDLIERLEAERKRREAEEKKRAEDERQRQIALAARAAALAARPPTDAKPGDAQGNEARADESVPARQAALPPPVRLDPQRPKGIRPFSSAQGAVLLPVAGRIVRRFGDPDEFGATGKGLSLATRPGAQVVAPFDGRIEFAGPFRGYGQILIIEHGDGYHSLLAGLERADAAVGQWLLAGEPVGTVRTGEAKPSLYFELRRNGQPINPLPWLSARDEKVTG